ncbi:MAG: 50S ribosomal protein L10 [Acidimicrobiales bacterium]
MENPRPEKVAIVDEVRERLSNAGGVVVTEYRGLNVGAMSSLRRELRPAGGAYKVYKNTLVRRAADEVGMDISDMLVGPTALAFVEQTPEGEPGDVVTVAKVLRDFAKANPNLIVKGGVLDNNVIDADGMKALADVEPREVLLAKLAGAIAAPMVQFAGLLQALPRDFAYGLQALIEKGGAGDAPAGSAPDASPSAEAEAAPAAEADVETDAAPAAEAEEAEQTTPADAGEEAPAESGEESES